MNCESCGKELKEGANFCAHCGAEVKSQVGAGKISNAETPPTAASDTPADGTPVVLYKRNTQKSAAIACSVLIAIVLVVLAVLLVWKSLMPKELILDENTIKDEALRNTLIVSYDKDGDGKLSEQELGDVKTLELDSGDDYSYIYLFRNLEDLNVKNQDVTSLDLSKNTNLKSGDFKDATNIKDIKFPDIPSYDEVKLPDNKDLNVVFPSGSDYEVKYVPKKVAQGGMLYEQEIENAFKVNSLSVTGMRGSSSKYTYTYDQSGRISNSNYFNYDYDDNNQLVQQQATSSNKPTENYGDFNFRYLDDGRVDTAGNYKFSSNDDEIALDYESINQEYGSTTGLWSFKSGKLSEYVYHAGNGSSYQTNSYEYDGLGNCTKITVSSFTGQNIGDDARKHDVSPQELYSLSFEYDSGNKPVKATFSTGGVGVYEYDAKGCLSSVTFDGVTDSRLDVEKLNCTIYYVPVIAKKNQTPLSFLVIPGKTSKNIINLFAYTRQIGFSYDWNDANFTGKFWWDEENIINNQVEVANRKKQNPMM